jgi:hypothetical protein
VPRDVRYGPAGPPFGVRADGSNASKATHLPRAPNGKAERTPWRRFGLVAGLDASPKGAFRVPSGRRGCPPVVVAVSETAAPAAVHGGSASGPHGIGKATPSGASASRAAQFEGFYKMCTSRLRPDSRATRCPKRMAGRVEGDPILPAHSEESGPGTPQRSSRPAS